MGVKGIKKKRKFIHAGVILPYFGSMSSGTGTWADGMKVLTGKIT